ncbi:MAG TPA: hypothetical protein PKN96_10370 [Flavobacterium sp.]|uniref:hypothetical protein n=1 Tax=Flavobacterium sp. TaxID=239 RepID=UPI002C730A67|nr:hypothetical protein [Flavobacterium sp.]HNP33686.1 hypothetical protein [Flavobacterium sp.]
MKRNNTFFTAKNALYLIAFYVVLLVLRMHNGNFYLDDSYDYLQVAQKIANGDFFSTHDEIVSKRPFLYPLFLLLSFGFNPYVILFLQAVLLFLTFCLFGKILAHFKITATNKLMFLLIVTPSVFIYAQLVMSEILAAFLLMLLLYFFVIDFSFKKIKYIQILLLLLVFTKPVFYPFAFINTALMIYYCFRKKQFTFWIFAPILTLLLYTNYNERKFGYRHFSSIENYNLVQYNLYYFKSFSESKTEADRWLNEVNASISTKDFAQKNMILKHIAHKEISGHFFSYAAYHCLTGIRGVFDPGRFDLMTFRKKEDGKQGFLEILNGNKSVKTLFSDSSSLFIYGFLLLIFIALLVKYFYFIKYFLSNKLHFYEVYFLVLILYYILVTGPVNCSRYMMPFQLIIIIFTLKSFHQIKTNAD